MVAPGSPPPKTTSFTPPLAALTVAVCVVFGVVAALAGHALLLASLAPGQFHAAVALAVALGVPITRLAHRTMRRRRDTLLAEEDLALLASSMPSSAGFARPMLLTATAGAALGLLLQGYTALTLAPWDTLWVLGVSLGKERGTWFLLAAVAGALVSVAGGVPLVLGLRALARSPAALDAAERLGVPALATATLAAAGLLFALNEDELGAGAGVLTLGLGGLAWRCVQDARRLGFVRRVFSGDEPGVEIVWQPGAVELRDLLPVADLTGEVVLAARPDAAGAAYRTTARGRGLMLLGDTLEETSAPILRRLRIASACAAIASCAALMRIAALVLSSE